MSFLRSALALCASVLLACACSGVPIDASFPSSNEGNLDGTPEADDPGFLPASQMGSPGAAREGVMTDPGELPTLKVATDGNKPLPLQHTDVKAVLAGFTADVEVRQTYGNPYKKVIEASYVFPLPENAAVYSMKMQIGDRVIEAVVEERGAARRTYERARTEGHTAALLEQERPNVFTQSVANIEPGKKIDVVIKYVQDLSYDAGEYEFVFPMVVGPRYIPGGGVSDNGTVTGSAAVPDASRITPPVLGNGQRSGHDISLDVVASAAGVVSSFTVPTHDVKQEPRGDGALHLQLSDADSIPNRDFVLRYKVAGPKPGATLYATGRNEGFFSLVVQPPALDVDALVGKRELVFVVDVSGSMTGQPLGLCKTAMRAALAQVRPVDTFNVITFAGATGKLFAKPRPANDVAIREALSYVDRLTAGGGTEMLDAISAALTPDVEKGRRRYVFFMTDGYVGNEDQILSATQRFVSGIEAKGEQARVFGFGTGSSTNRMLLEGLGKQGKGLTVYVGTRESPVRAVNRFYRYIDRTILRKVRVDWGALGATDVQPEELPDLFASHPIILHGRYKGSLRGPVTVHAKSGDGDVDIPVTIARAPMDDGWPIQDLLWARSRIATLESALWDQGSSAKTKKEITDLGIEHHLVTQFTSFVAVDRSKVVGDGHPAYVEQPVETPEGVDAKMAGARVMTLDSAEAEPTGAQAEGYAFDQEDVQAVDVPNSPPASIAAAQRDERANLMAPPDFDKLERNKLDQQIVSAKVDPGPRGCNCHVAGERSAGAAAFAASLALVLAWIARRRRGRGARGPAPEQAFLSMLIRRTKPRRAAASQGTE